MVTTNTELEDAFLALPNSPLFANVASVLECDRSEIHVLEQIRTGNMNLNYIVQVDGKKYVYRHPGPGTEIIVNRKSEAMSQQIAGQLGIDGTFIYQHPTDGWKLSSFIEGAKSFDYHDEQHVAKAMSVIRTLHDCGQDSGFPVDMHEDTLRQIPLLSDEWKNLFPDFAEMLQIANALNVEANARGRRIVLCHNDFYDTNLLLTDDSLNLIDWEFSGMSDYASDLAVFICCSDYTFDEAMGVLGEYFQRDPSPDELFHCVAYLGVVSFHWLVWALYQETIGASTPFLQAYYDYTHMFESAALEMLEEVDAR